MTPEQIDRVFGRGRLKMVTGDHVEVFREAAAKGDRRRYTKRFLNTIDVDFGQWTEREWRILARLIGHGIGCVPEVVQFDRGTQLVQTYDAGATVDQWATILPVSREGRVLRHVFEDCAHWWALAHHCLRALLAIHELSVVHLDIKGDNVCIPVGPSSFDPKGRGLRLYPRFAELALIDFAFALVSRESLTTALPIGWQTDYDYQSPRLLNALEAGRRGDLQPTRELDWRCDMYSLAAMLKRYLPEEDAVFDEARATGWSPGRAGAAKELILALRDAHDRDSAHRRPHQELIELTAARLAETDMAASLQAGWTLARDAIVTPVAASPLTPLTRLAPSIRVLVSPRAVHPITAAPTVIRRRVQAAPPAPPRTRISAAAVLTTLVGAVIAAITGPAIYDHLSPRVVPEVPQQRESLAEAPEPAAADPVKEEAKPAPAPATAAEAPTKSPSSAVSSAPSGSRPAANVSRSRSAHAVAEPPRAATPSRPATAPASVKSPPAQVASVRSAPAQPRVRFHEEEPARNASIPAPDPQAAHIIALAPAPTAQTPAPPAPAATEPPRNQPPATEPARVTQSTPRASSHLELVPELRQILSYFSNFAKRSDRAAPIEDRSRADPVKIVPAPIDTAYASPSPAVAPPPPQPEAPMVVPANREPAPRAMPPPEVLAAQARRTLSEAVPQTAARVEADMARVLWVAANANHPSQERDIVEAVRRPWSSNALAASSGFSPAVARQLSEDARQAFMVQRDVASAFDLQLRAFGANPRDAEVAGNLAFLYLKLNPPQPEIARQVAVHAIAVGTGQARTARVEDWNTFAVASALTGRERDATNAFFVTIALTRNLDRTCKSAQSAIDTYGERLIAPVQAMMLRIRQQGRDGESPYCAWSPRWQTARGSY
jgi:hypothetical protein